MGGIIPSEDAFNRMADATRHFEGTYRDPTKEGQRRLRLNAGCRSRNEVWQIIMFGTPTGGTFDVDIKVGGTTDTLTFNWDDTSTEVATELATHTNITSGDVTVTGGPFPDAAITITFTGDLANSKFDTPEFDHSLTGGSGVGVVIVKYAGHPTDGSAA